MKGKFFELIIELYKRAIGELDAILKIINFMGCNTLNTQIIEIAGIKIAKKDYLQIKFNGEN